MIRLISLTSVWVIAGLFIAATAQGEDAAQPAAVARDPQQSQARKAEVESASAAHLRAAVKQAIKRWPKRDLPSEEAVRELVGLYRQLKADERLAASERQRLLAAVRTRLVRVHKRLVKELALQADKAVGAMRAPDDVPAEEGPAHRTSRSQAGRSHGKAGAAAPVAPAEPAEADPQNGGGANALDNGQQLVELIQEVVAPDIWDVNGGPAAIRYYSPLKVLVVTAPGNVHGDVGAVLDGLR